MAVIKLLVLSVSLHALACNPVSSEGSLGLCGKAAVFCALESSTIKELNRLTHCVKSEIVKAYCQLN